MNTGISYLGSCVTKEATTVVIMNRFDEVIFILHFQPLIPLALMLSPAVIAVRQHRQHPVRVLRQCRQMEFLMFLPMATPVSLFQALRCLPATADPNHMGWMLECLPLRFRLRHARQNQSRPCYLYNGQKHRRPSLKSEHMKQRQLASFADERNPMIDGGVSQMRKSKKHARRMFFPCSERYIYFSTSWSGQATMLSDKCPFAASTNFCWACKAEHCAHLLLLCHPHMKVGAVETSSIRWKR